MDFKELIQARYSCKKFGDAQVSDDQLQEVLEAGRMAPTAKNLQEQHIYVARSAEPLAWIDEVTPCRYGAPVCLIVAFDKTNTYTYPGGKRESGIEDASIVATHMMLGAKNAGVDSCWVNCFDPDLLAEKMDLPENEEILMLLMLGHAAPGDPVSGPLPNHFNRKPLTETVSYI